MSEPTHVAGRLEIPVEADLSDFATNLRTKVEAIANSIKAKVGIEFEDEKTLRTRLQTAVDTAAKGVTAKVKAKIDVDKDHVEQAAKDAGAAVTKALSKRGAEIKVEADDKATRQAVGIVARMKAWARTQSVEIPVNMGSPRGPTPPPGGRNRFGPAGMAFRPTMMLGLLSLIQPLIALVMQSLGGLVAMLGSVGSSIYGVVGLIPMLSALGAAIGVSLIAFKGWDAEGKNAVRSMQQVKGEVTSLKDEWEELTHSVRHAVWDGVAGQIRPLGEKILPVLTKGLSGVGQEVGWLMRAMATQMGTTWFLRDLDSILETSKSLTRSLGRGLGGLLLWFKDMSVAAGPFAESMGKGFQEFGAWTATLLNGRGERLAFQEWLRYVGDKATEFGRILKNTWTALGGIFRAGRESGDRLMATLEDVTEKWSRWSNSLEGQNTMKAWFATAEEGTRKVGTLLVELGKSLARLGDDPALAGLVQRLTDELLPDLEAFLRQLGTTLGPVVIDFISNMLELLSHLSEAGGPLSTFISALNELVEAVNAGIESVPGLASAIGILVAGMIAMRPAKFIVEGVATALGALTKVTGAGKFTGILGLVSLLTGLAAYAEGADGAVSDLAVALGAMLLLGPRLRTFGTSMSTWATATTAATVATYSTNIGRLTGSLGGLSRPAAAATTAMKGMTTALSGAYAMMGGPWGVAIGIATLAVGAWYREHQKAKEELASHTEELKANNGAFTDRNRELVATALLEEDAFTMAEAVGIGRGTLINAVLGEETALKNLNTVLGANIKSYDDTWAAGKQVTDQQQLKYGWSQQLMNILGGESKVVNEAVAEYEKYAEAQAAAAESSEEVQSSGRGLIGFTETMVGLYEAAERALRDYVDQMQRERDMNLTARESVRRSRDAYRDANEAINRFIEDGGNLADVLDGTGLAFDTNTEAGSRFEGMMDDIGQTTWDSLEKLSETDATVDELNARWAEGNGHLDALGERLGLSAEAMAILREAVGLTDAEYETWLGTVREVPSEVKTDVKIETEEAKGKLHDYSAAIDANPKDTKTTAGFYDRIARDKLAGLQKAFDDNPKDLTTQASLVGVAEARERAKGLKQAYDDNPKDVTTQASFKERQAKADAEAWRKLLDRLPKTKDTKVNVPGATGATGLVAIYRGWLDALPKKKDTNIASPGAEVSRSKIQAFIDMAGRVPGSKSTTVSANTGSAYNSIWGIINSLRNIVDRSVTVTTYHRTLRTAVADGAIFNADGGVHDGPRPGVAKFAGGGMPFWEQKLQNRVRNGFHNVENHIAQILPAGAWRVWAEDETGGEAYIPLAPGKRGRSLAILREVASRFGMAMYPMAAQFATGSLALPAMATAAASTSRSSRDNGGTRVVFEDGSIRIDNPTPEPASKTVATIARGFTIDGLFGTGD